MSESAIEQILKFYPRIYFACHTRHVTDPKTAQTLTSHQASILDHLDREEGVSLFDLAGHMGVTPSTMSIGISRLENLGYVQKEKDVSDARKTLLCLTDRGEKIKRSKSVLDPERLRKVLLRLSKEEQELSIKGLALLAAASDLEMKSLSLSKAWGSRGKRKEESKHTRTKKRSKK
ncbi:hypothetical protein CH373_14510 [Leptospira perolatii]|uniref:HTH marR-type domain-containing protein n=1 Tax=Leptospira perolatii TaxID=2023191 RepID=A0A2M9ZK97_9LEPT|nr:MarR family winged helix-turn-helix transcriptional regulator [Leptospira perolatii]PJZ69255.1 hypothetical protein CH360_12110 [Leptospira perolatii]PJZ72363.1 hypothetical protein CH373_14510 [Leptospira perolatii]